MNISMMNMLLTFLNAIALNLESFQGIFREVYIPPHVDLDYFFSKVAIEAINASIEVEVILVSDSSKFTRDIHYCNQLAYVVEKLHIDARYRLKAKNCRTYLIGNIINTNEHLKVMVSVESLKANEVAGNLD